MQQKSSTKSVLMFLGILVVLAGTYFYMTGKPAEDPSLVAEDAGVSGTMVGNDVVVLLNQIKQLNIDKSLFSSPAYTSLVDHTVQINDQPVGKANPFFNPKRTTTTR